MSLIISEPLQAAVLLYQLIDDYIMEQYVIIMWKPSIRKAGHMEFRKANAAEMHEISKLFAGGVQRLPAL